MNGTSIISPDTGRKTDCVTPVRNSRDPRKLAVPWAPRKPIAKSLPFSRKSPSARKRLLFDSDNDSDSSRDKENASPISPKVKNQRTSSTKNTFVVNKIHIEGLCDIDSGEGDETGNETDDTLILFSESEGEEDTEDDNANDSDIDTDCSTDLIDDSDAISSGDDDVFYDDGDDHNIKAGDDSITDEHNSSSEEYDEDDEFDSDSREHMCSSCASFIYDRFCIGCNKGDKQLSCHACKNYGGLWM
jgi:hypothetical protein